MSKKPSSTNTSTQTAQQDNSYKTIVTDIIPQSEIDKSKSKDAGHQETWTSTDTGRDKSPRKK